MRQSWAKISGGARSPATTRWVAGAVMIAAVGFAAETGRPGTNAGELVPAAARRLWAAESPAPAGLRSPRDFYNDGTRNLQKGKLREAEQSLQNAAAGFDEAVQQAALYNLGWVRFRQGEEALREGPNAAARQAAARLTLAAGSRAVQDADAALAADEVNAILAAYRQGRGVLKDLKAAAAAVKRAMDAHGIVLLRWQRAEGDFKSAHELRDMDADAQANADYVDRRIAALIDQINPMQMQSQGVRNKQTELGQKMAELKKRLPPGARQEGDDDDDEDEQSEPKKGQQEAPSTEGRDMSMTLEEAGRLLDALILDANRKLPMGVRQTDKPAARAGRDW